MIPSVDTYVYHQLERNLKAILKHPDILAQALAGIDEKARTNFIKTYAGETPKKEIEVGYQFPGTKETFDARFVVQMGTGHETTRSLGSVEGTFTFREGEEAYENSVIEDGGDNLYIELSQPIGAFHSATSVSFSKSDNLTIDGNRLVFRKAGNERLVGLRIGINYLSKVEVDQDEDPVGLQKGYSSNEEIEITPISTNMDTARCLDAILKVIMIVMLDNREEKTGFLLQKLTFNGMQNIVSDTDRLVFGRPLTVEYVVTYSVDYDLTQKLTSVILRGLDSIE